MFEHILSKTLLVTGAFLSLYNVVILEVPYYKKRELHMGDIQMTIILFIGALTAWEMGF